MMRLTLEAAGYEVDEAADGEDGLARFGDGGDYDAVAARSEDAGPRRPGDAAADQGARAGACVVMVTAFASIELAVDAMRLGATDFLRKPMTPETLRGAVAAAIASRPIARGRAAWRAAARRGPFEIAVADAERVSDPPSRTDDRAASSEHVFRVKHVADGVEFTVTVAIDPEAVERVARLTHRRLEPGGAFWRLQAERLLSA